MENMNGRLLVHLMPTGLRQTVCGRWSAGFPRPVTTRERDEVTCPACLNPGPANPPAEPEDEMEIPR